MDAWWSGTRLVLARGLQENVRSKTFKIVMALLLLTPLVLRLTHRSEETLLVVEDDADQKAKAAQT